MSDDVPEEDAPNTYGNSEDQITLNEAGINHFEDVLGRREQYLPAKSMFTGTIPADALPNSTEAETAYLMDYYQLRGEDQASVLEFIAERFDMPQKAARERVERNNGKVPVRGRFVAVVGSKNPMKYL